MLDTIESTPEAEQENVKQPKNPHKKRSRLYGMFDKGVQDIFGELNASFLSVIFFQDSQDEI